MDRFIVERTFPRGLAVPPDRDGRITCASVIAVNAAFGVTWIQSFVSQGGRKTYCLYEAPSEEAVRLVAERNGLPWDRITPVSVISPFQPTR